MHSGWIKLHRKINKWEWKQKPLTLALFIHLIINANHEPGRWQGIEVKRGQIITGRKKLSLDTGLSERQVRTALNHLKSTNEVTIKTTKNYSIITMVNYDMYQDKSPQSDQRPTNDRPTTDHKQECKNEKNILGGDFAPPPPKEKKSSKKGTRLSNDWALEKEWGDWALKQGLSYQEVIDQEDMFKDYWVSSAGAKAVKLDWYATWRNWIRRYIEKKGDKKW